MPDWDKIARTADEHTQCLAILSESLWRDFEKLEALDGQHKVPEGLHWLVLRLHSAAMAASEVMKATEDLALTIRTEAKTAAEETRRLEVPAESEPKPIADQLLG